VDNLRLPEYGYDMPDPIPSFDCPPINEVVIGLQFHPIKNFNVQFFSNYWSRVRDRYPTIDDQAPVAHAKDSPIRPQPDEHLLQVPSKMPVRYWLIDNSGNELIQVQPDRFLRNWRQVRGDEIYPRFGPLFDSFWREWVEFRKFVREEKRAELQLDQCELSYINHIEPDQKWEGFSGLPDVFSVLRKKEKPAFLPAPELFNWQSRYPLPDGTGGLNVEVAPAFRGKDMKLIVSFTLTARGMSNDASDDKVKAWFTAAHEWIVRGFDELTTPAMHKIWKKKS
jgi:uncharacterized protein (TIGR04255 family)